MVATLLQVHRNITFVRQHDGFRIKTYLKTNNVRSNPTIQYKGRIICRLIHTELWVKQ